MLSASSLSIIQLTKASKRLFKKLSCKNLYLLFFLLLLLICFYMAGFLYLLVWLQMKINRYMHKLLSEFTTLPLLNVQIKITSWDHKVFHKMFSFEFLFKVPSKIFGYWEIWTQPFCKSYLWFCEKVLRKEILEIRSWTVTAFLMYPRFLWWLAKNSRHITTRIFYVSPGQWISLYLFGFSSLRLIPNTKTEILQYQESHCQGGFNNIKKSWLTPIYFWLSVVMGW